MKMKSSKKSDAPLPNLDDFLLNVQANNFSSETLYNYERDLKVFAKFLEVETKISFDKITKRIIELYKAYLTSIDRRTAEGAASKMRLSAASVNRNLSSLRSYFKYLVDIDFKTPIAPEAIKLTKMPKKHPRVAEFETLVKLVESPTRFEQDKVTSLRNRAVLELLFATGMRIYR
jgi:integrase/recombinase XerD